MRKYDIGPKGEKTKQRILETAAAIIWKNSYHGISVDQIVRDAGVNKATFYQYFESKEQIAMECLQYMFESTLSYVFEESFAETSNPIERLESIFRRIYMTHKTVKKIDGKCPGCPFVNIGNELATSNEEIRNSVAKIFESFVKYHKKIYEDAQTQGLAAPGKNPYKVGKQIQLVINGAMTNSKLRNRPEEILDAIDTAKLLLSA